MIDRGRPYTIDCAINRWFDRKWARVRYLDSDRWHGVILIDYFYWTNQPLDQWCRTHGVECLGMAIEMDEPLIMMFALRWA